MPDPDKRDQDQDKEQPEEAVKHDALGNEISSDVPPLEIDEDETKGKDETPPDLVPDPDEQPKEIEEETTPFDDEKTDRAIDEIVAKEGDDILAAQDAAAAKGGVKVASKGGHWLSRFLHNKWARSLLLLVLLAAAAAGTAVPVARYWILNTAGVRSSSSLVVVDSATQLPLKGVQVTLGGIEAETNSEGKAEFSNLELGPTELTITQVGFQEIGRGVVIGWGSNPLGNFALKATGVQYVIEVRDYLSEKPLEGVEATDGQATAISGKDGKITLTLESSVVLQDGVNLSKAGYRVEKITLNEDPKKPTKASLVLARKTVFVTKESGKYDVYKSDIDGKNREILLNGTGNENSNISLAVSPDGSRVAFVSTRDNKRDADGFLLSSLMLVTIENGEKVTIAEAAQVQLIDWIGPRLIFQQASSDGSAGNRYTVVSYNVTNNTRLQLAAANKLNTVMGVQGVVYYAVAADASNPSVETGLFRINPEGNGKQRVIEDELTTVLRSAYNTLNMQTVDGTWYSYEVSKGTKSQIATPASLANRLYIDNADRTRSLWIGQGELKSYEIASTKETPINNQTGMTYPLQWISASAAIYRVSSGSETADYVISLEGGTSHKVADVTPTYGFAQAQ